MSKISPMQAEALGLVPAKPESKAASAPLAKKPAPVKAAVKKPVVKKAAVKKPAVAKPATVKPATVKSVAAKKPVAKAKPAAKPKQRKIKMERDSFTMPKEEYAQLTLLKARLTALGQPAKKSELLRAGIKLLVAMSDNTLKTTLAKVPVIKTGRPKKK